MAAGAASPALVCVRRTELPGIHTAITGRTHSIEGGKGCEEGEGKGEKGGGGRREGGRERRYSRLRRSMAKLSNSTREMLSVGGSR